MELQNKNYKELIDKIDYNNYLLGINSNLKKKQPKIIQPYQSLTQTRDKTPIYTRVKNLLNGENNNNIQNYNNPNERINISKKEINNNNSFQNVVQRNNGVNYLKNKNNPVNNYSINYAIRDSNYSNFSASGISNLTFNDMNSKYTYYKVLFHQLKGHNLALLNKLKNEKNLNGIIKELEKENLRLKNENKKLKENNNFHANSDGEEDNNRNNIQNNSNYNKFFDPNKQKGEGNIDKNVNLNYLISEENNKLKDEIRNSFKNNKKLYGNEGEKNYGPSIGKNNFGIMSDHNNIENNDKNNDNNNYTDKSNGKISNANNNVDNNSKIILDYINNLKNNNKGNNIDNNNKIVLDFLSDLKDNKNKLKKFNKNEILSIVESLQNKNEEQKKELINLYNKLISEKDEEYSEEIGKGEKEEKEGKKRRKRIKRNRTAK